MGRPELLAAAAAVASLMLSCAASEAALASSAAFWAASAAFSLASALCSAVRSDPVGSMSGATGIGATVGYATAGAAVMGAVEGAGAAGAAPMGSNGTSGAGEPTGSAPPTAASRSLISSSRSEVAPVATERLLSASFSFSSRCSSKSSRRFSSAWMPSWRSSSCSLIATSAWPAIFSRSEVASPAAFFCSLLVHASKASFEFVPVMIPGPTCVPVAGLPPLHLHLVSGQSGTSRLQLRMHQSSFASLDFNHPFTSSLKPSVALQTSFITGSSGSGSGAVVLSVSPQ
mmetsp:Transcript_18285/g.43451  ORF Transcript_18285/g.43451 Transcript_18285/m.43451 type:complete len:287 (+) Transcript_18285:241-1101(+)